MEFKISVEYNGMAGIMERIEKFLMRRHGVELNTDHNRRTIHAMSIDYACETHVHMGADGGGEDPPYWYLNTVVHHDGRVYIRNRVYFMVKLVMRDTPVNTAYVSAGPTECEVEFRYDSHSSKHFASQAFRGLKAHLAEMLVFPYRPPATDVTDWTRPVPIRTAGMSAKASGSALDTSLGDAPSARPSLDNIGRVSADCGDAPSARPTMEILGARPPMEAAVSIGVMPPAHAAGYHK
jgi:hypothetical protein